VQLEEPELLEKVKMVEPLLEPLEFLLLAAVAVAQKITELTHQMTKVVLVEAVLIQRLQVQQ
jgi:hypothetical protein